MVVLVLPGWKHVCVWIQRSFILNVCRVCFILLTANEWNASLLGLHIFSCWTVHSCLCISDWIIYFSWSYLSTRCGSCGSSCTSAAKYVSGLSLKLDSCCWSLSGGWYGNSFYTPYYWSSSFPSTVLIFCGVLVGSPSTPVGSTSPISWYFLSPKVIFSG